MIDSHAHVLFERFDTDRDAVIRRAREAGLTGWLEIGTDVATSQRAVEFVQNLDGVYASVGVHPSDIAGFQETDWQTIEGLLQQPKVVAVGEVGLDYYRGGTGEEQLPVLERFVRLADKHNLPVIFHVRDGKETSPVKESTDSHGASAHDDMISFLQKYARDREGLRPPKAWRRGVMHTFSGNQEQAQHYLDLGMFLSFSGVVTFKNAKVTQEVARTVIADRMLIETDCPFLAPEPFRGQRNEPAYVKYVAAKIAQLRGVAIEEIIAQTTTNTRTLFAL